MAFDQYTQLTIIDPSVIEICPCCGSRPELWQYQSAEGEAASKAVMCSNGDAFGPQDAIIDEGCPLNMPSQGFYHATVREATKYWNEYAKALTSQQRKNRWQEHKVFRQSEDAKQEGAAP